MPTSSDLDMDTQEHWPNSFPEQFTPVVFPPDWHQQIALRARLIVEASRANRQKRKQARALVVKTQLDGVPGDQINSA